MKNLTRLCLAKLASFKTTLKQDVEDEQKYEMGGQNMSYNEYNCTMIRVIEKNILNMWLELSQAILPLLADGLSMKQVTEMSQRIESATFD